MENQARQIDRLHERMHAAVKDDDWEQLAELDRESLSIADAIVALAKENPAEISQAQTLLARLLGLQQSTITLAREKRDTSSLELSQLQSSSRAIKNYLS